MASPISLLRHGETEWSRTGRHTGRTELPLTGEGERRAALLRTRLQGIRFAAVLTSPRLRARRTCELAGLGSGARVEPDLHEWDYGDYEGRTTADILAERPGWNLFCDGCPHGESVEDISRRADRLLAALRPLPGAVALFSHGHFLRVLAVRWIGLPVRQGQHLALDTASISILGHEPPGGGMPVLSVWNAGVDDVTHALASPDAKGAA